MGGFAKFRGLNGHDLFLDLSRVKYFTKGNYETFRGDVPYVHVQLDENHIMLNVSEHSRLVDLLTSDGETIDLARHFYLLDRLEGAESEITSLKQNLHRLKSERDEMRRLLYDVDQCAPYSLDQLEEGFRGAVESVRHFFSDGEPDADRAS